MTSWLSSSGETSRWQGHPSGVRQPVHSHHPSRTGLVGEESAHPLHFTPVGSSWLNQIETWFGLITRQSIGRGTFSSVKVLIKQIRDYIKHWNTSAKPFAWTATTDETTIYITSSD
jgi:transposase